MIYKIINWDGMTVSALKGIITKLELEKLCQPTFYITHDWI